MKINTRLPIVILGGMGPDASARLVARIVELSRLIGGAQNSDDYPNFVMQNIPVPDFFDNPKLYKKGVNLLKRSIKNLDKLKPSYFVLACNTVHSVLPELKKVTRTKFLELPELVMTNLEREGLRKVGLLATPLTYQSGIYEKAITNSLIDLVTPNKSDQSIIGEIVHLVLSGKFEKARERIIGQADKLVEKGAEVVVLGCTELPLIFPKRYKVPVVSSIETLAREIVIKYYQREEI